MKPILITLILILPSCETTTSELENKLKKEVDFNEFINQVETTKVVNETVIKDTDEKTKKIIQETTNNIISLKNEVKILKKENNELKAKINSINSNTTSKPFNLLPISDN